MTEKNIFYMFGILQAITLGLIIFFILQTATIEMDTAIVLSVLCLKLKLPPKSF